MTAFIGTRFGTAVGATGCAEGSPDHAAMHANSQRAAFEHVRRAIARASSDEPRGPGSKVFRNSDPVLFTRALALPLVFMETLSMVLNSIATPGR